MKYIYIILSIFIIVSCDKNSKQVAETFARLLVEGAIKKDGPSAGVSITSAILSLLLNKEVPKEVAMTGEISLKGDVLKVGGLREKIIGAYNNGVTKIFIPYTNSCDLEEIPNIVKEQIDIVLVKNYEEIFNALFK